MPSSSTYSVVPTGTTASDDDEEPCSCIQKYLLGGSLTDEQKVALASSRPEHQQPLVLRLHSESIRQIAYAFFWSMCILAIVLSKTMIPPQVIEESDLKDVFGYNNVSIMGLCKLIIHRLVVSSHMFAPFRRKLFGNIDMCVLGLHAEPRIDGLVLPSL
jgi:hypothetical protein